MFLYSIYLLFYILTAVFVISTRAVGSCMCIEATQCYPYIYSMSRIFHEGGQPEVLDFWRDKFCGYDFRIPKVCCDIFPPQGPFETRPTTPPFIESILQKVDDSRAKNSPTVTTSKLDDTHNTDCICIPLPDCEPFKTLARHSGSPLTPSLIKFFRSQQCGFEDDTPKVCCPPESQLASIIGNQKLETFPHDSNGYSQTRPTQEPITTPSQKPLATLATVNFRPPVREEWSLPEKSRIINQHFSNYDMFELLRRSLRPKNNSEPRPV